MRAPAFWWRRRLSPLSMLLRPASLAYGAVAGLRMRRTGARAAIPVVCIGNFTVGGAGKTPTAIAVAGLLRTIGRNPAFLSRGYGGTLPGPVRVSETHTAAEVGDEPLLLARSGPTMVSRKRPAGVRLAAAQGANVVVMDDGLQNPSLVKDLAIAVVDGATGIGNGLPLPAGPLRAPMRVQWEVIDAVVVIGDGAAGDDVAAAADKRGKTVLRARLMPDKSTVSRLEGKRVLAFAGIGRPEKFFETLTAMGAFVAVRRPFPDHHPFKPSELEALKAEAQQDGLLLVSTEKDLIRIARSPDLRDFASAVLAVPVHLQVDDAKGLRNLLSHALARARPDLGGEG